MQTQILVVSDPPHTDVNEAAVASILRLDVENTRLKVGFSAPEVLGASDPEPARELATALRRAGMSVAIVDGRELASVPWPTPVAGVSSGPSSVRLRVAAGEIEIGVDEPIFGVYCKPPSGFLMEGAPTTPERLAGAPGLAVAEAVQWTPLLDLYHGRGDAVHRYTIAPGLTDFASFTEDGAQTPESLVAMTVHALARRLRGLELDRRMEGVRPRHRFVMGEQGFDLDLRKLYSFGTLLLRQVLDSISSDLKDVPHYELSSRLAYVLRSQRG